MVCINNGDIYKLFSRLETSWGSQCRDPLKTSIHTLQNITVQNDINCVKTCITHSQASYTWFACEKALEVHMCNAMKIHTNKTEVRSCMHILFIHTDTLLNTHA